ncbi:MAG: SGNH/GDSL hydrolase family protein [Terracidiphilus sp.]
MTPLAAIARRLVLKVCGILALAAFSANATNAQTRQFALHDGDTVVFYGDSITAQRLYTRFVEEFALTRYPALHFRFVNAGVPGDTAYGGYAGAVPQRVERDVAQFHPAMITVMLGMNDGGYVPESEKIDAVFQKGYRDLLDALHKAAPNAALTLITPTPYDEITHGTEFPGYSGTITKNAEDVLQIGAQLQSSGDKTLLIADFHRPLTEALTRAKADFPQLAPLMIPDRIHPADAGHWSMAAALMSVWHVDPIVSSVTLNAAAVKITHTERTTITKLEKSAHGLTWTQLDEALPLPLDLNSAMTPVLLTVSNIADFDSEILRIESLEPGQYRLLIDAKPIAVFSREDLERGVNLALYKTPMLGQARGIDWEEERRAALDEARFILSAEVKQTATSPAAEERLAQAQDELAATIRTSATPKPHNFELRRQ